MERCSRCSALKFLGRGSVQKEVADAVFLKFEHGFICGIRSAELAARKPASIGRLRAGRPETRVNSGLEDRSPENTRKHWAGGQPFRRCPFYAGFRAGGVAGADEVRGMSSANGDGSMSDDFQALCLQAFLAPVFALASRPQRQADIMPSAAAATTPAIAARR